VNLPSIRSDPRFASYGPEVFPVQGVTHACEFMVLRVQAHMVLSPCVGWKRGSDETSSPLALPAIARREVFRFLCCLLNVFHGLSIRFNDGYSED